MIYIYIIFYHKNNEPSNDIKNNKTELFDLNRKKKEELNFISKDILYLETFYNIKTSKTYIIFYIIILKISLNLMIIMKKKSIKNILKILKL